MSDSNNPLVAEVLEWLQQSALRVTTIGDILTQTCERLAAAGIPLWRVHLAYSTLHPLIASQSSTWTRDGGLESEEHAHGLENDGWLRSPLKFVIDRELPFFRRHLRGAGALVDFPFLEDLRARGGADYLAFAIPFREEITARAEKDGVAGSWSTDQLDGFSNADLEHLMRVQQSLALVCKVQLREQITRNILATYLGADAGDRVLRGNIRRGDGERIHAVVWYSDMRNSTPLADALSDAEFLGALNAYFECSAGAVVAHGGEVLRFVGDAVLGIFPVRGGDTVTPAHQALAAAADAQQRLVTLNRDRAAHNQVELDFGLALHLGEVMFGNIGIPERLEFSVIGPVANEVARMESLTKTLGQRVVCSAALARELGNELVSLGHHDLRGVASGLEVFGVVPELRHEH